MKKPFTFCQVHQPHQVQQIDAFNRGPITLSWPSPQASPITGTGREPGTFTLLPEDFTP